MDKAPEISQVQDFYDEFLHYLVQDRIEPNPRHERIKLIAERFVSSDQTILDLGCGIGITSEFMAERAKRVVGVDLSPRLIRYAQATVKNVEFRVGDIVTLRLNQDFDHICLFDCLEHVPQERYAELFETLRLHARENGQVLITIPNPRLIAHLQASNADNLQIVDESIDLIMLMTLAQQAGFALIRLDAYGVDFADQYLFLNLTYLPEGRFVARPLHRRSFLRRLVRRWNRTGLARAMRRRRYGLDVVKL